MTVFGIHHVRTLCSLESAPISPPAVRSLPSSPQPSREDGCCVVCLQKWVLRSCVSHWSTVKMVSGKTDIKVIHDTKVLKFLDGVLAHI